MNLYSVHDLDSALERFLCKSSDESAEWLAGEWSEGNLIEAIRVPADLLTPALLMAAFARAHGVQIVDLYGELCRKWEEHVRTYAIEAHPDNWLASVCCQNRRNGRPDTPHVFEQLWYYEMFEALFGEEL